MIGTTRHPGLRAGVHFCKPAQKVNSLIHKPVTVAAFNLDRLVVMDAGSGPGMTKFELVVDR